MEGGNHVCYCDWTYYCLKPSNRGEIRTLSLNRNLWCVHPLNLCDSALVFFLPQCKAEVGYLKDINTLSLLEGMRASLCGAASVRTARAGKKWRTSGSPLDISVRPQLAWHGVTKRRRPAYSSSLRASIIKTSCVCLCVWHFEFKIYKKCLLWLSYCPLRGANFKGPNVFSKSAKKKKKSVFF